MRAGPLAEEQLPQRLELELGLKPWLGSLLLEGFDRLLAQLVMSVELERQHKPLATHIKLLVPRYILVQVLTAYQLQIGLESISRMAFLE